MTSVGNDGFPSVLKALKSVKEVDIEIIGVDSKPLAAGLYLCDKGFVIEPRENPRHFESLNRFLEATKADFFWPLSTVDQVFYASRLEKLSSSINRKHIILSDESALRIANNKFHLLNFLANNGFNTLKFRKVKSIEEIDNFLPAIDFPASPFVLKTDEGTGAQGVKIVFSDLPSRQKLFGRNNLNITYSELIYHLKRIEDWPQMHITEFLPGTEYSVDVLCKEGRIYSIVIRRRYDTLFGLAITAEVIKFPEIEEATREIIKALKLSFIVNLQFRLEACGKPQLIEINPRIPGTIGLTTMANVNMPYLALQLAMGEPIPDFIEPNYGLFSVRYWSLIGVQSTEIKTL